MADRQLTIALEDLVATTTQGVLRALEARGDGLKGVSSIDLVRAGFFVDISIIAGGNPGPILNKQLQGGGGALGQGG